MSNKEQEELNYLLYQAKIKSRDAIRLFNLSSNIASLRKFKDSEKILNEAFDSFKDSVSLFKDYLSKSISFIEKSEKKSK